jgi:hypothetical protein
MSGPRRTRSSARPAVREDVFLPTTGPSVAPRAVGVAELVRRLGEAESKLQSSERDRAADAELIGNLLGELGERDRRIKALEQRAIDDETRRVELETELAMAESHPQVDDERTRELEEALKRTDALFAELLRRLSDAHGGDVDVSQLHDLLAVTLSTLDLTRTFTSETKQKLEETRAAMGNVGAREAAAGLGETVARARGVLDVSVPLDRSIARVVDRLRDIEKRERELGELRGDLLHDAGELVFEVQQLRDAMGNLARRPGSIPRMRKAPSKLPTRKR